MTDDRRPLIVVGGNRTVAPISRCPRCGSRSIAVDGDGHPRCGDGHRITLEERLTHEQRVVNAAERILYRDRSKPR